MRVAFVYSAIKLHLHVAPLLNGLLVAASQWNPTFDSFCWKKKNQLETTFACFQSSVTENDATTRCDLKKNKHSELITTDTEAIWTSWTKCSLISNLFDKDEVFRSSKCLGVEGNICCNIFHSLSVTLVFTSFQPGLLIKREAHLCLCLQPPPPPSLPLIFLLKRMLCCTCRVFRTKQIFRNAYFCFVFWEIDQAKQVSNFSFICPMYVTVRDTLNTLVRPARSCRRPNVKPISLIWETALVLGYSNPHKNL